MSRLSDYRLLSFDVYGTLIDWEGGILAALHPLLEKNNAVGKFDRKTLLEQYHVLERKQQIATPDMIYSEVLTAVHPVLAEEFGFPKPTMAESQVFGASVGSWPAFPDTVDALKRLSKFYKLLILSNVDRESIRGTLIGPLSGVHFDKVITAQDIGSYKPDPRNFEGMLKVAKEEFGIEKEQVLQTAQSQFHDHHPARSFGIRSVWIERTGATMGNLSDEIYDWKFDKMVDMADALEKEV
ncbi:haloacid dehalogenase [Cadophora sp. DSE1049]|nr:haloacid dehalogenase [Cadophora sp. DSE1049]